MSVNKIGVIIPASDQNRYSIEGDLAKFGNTNLLEWKIEQLKTLFTEKNIYVSSSSSKILNISEKLGVRTIERKPDLALESVVVTSVQSVDFDHILWTNVTSPFLSATDYAQMVEKYSAVCGDNATHDSILAVERLQEYFYYKDAPLNFNPSKIESRSKLEPAYRVTNGCAIIKKEQCLKLKTYYGLRPAFHEVGRLAAFEIKDFEYMNIAVDLISLYFKRVLAV